jgi:DNA-binding transcriptional ArsR family regulator
MSSNVANVGGEDERTGLRFRRRDESVDSETVLSVLDDPDCRRLLEATTDEALTAQELTDRCDVPRSTTYRKVEQLTEAGLLEEGVRLRRDGKHTSEYHRTFEDVTISLSEGDGFEVGISRAEPVAGD